MLQIEIEHNGRKIGADLFPEHDGVQKVMVHIEGNLVGLGQWVKNPGEEKGFIWGIAPQQGLKSTGLTDDDYKAIDKAINSELAMRELTAEAQKLGLGY